MARGAIPRFVRLEAAHHKTKRTGPESPADAFGEVLVFIDGRRSF